MSHKDKWVIEGVYLLHPNDPLYPEEEKFLRGDLILAQIRGRMDDGRAFYCENRITQAFYDDVGEARLIEILRADARPPEGA